MKQLFKKLLICIASIAYFGTTYAQSDLLADNTTYAPSNIVALYRSDDKITFSELMQNENNTSQLTVKCTNPTTVQMKFFKMDGSMAKQESRTLNTGINELNVSLDNLAAGTYMVQFYSSEGSAVRRIVKSN